MKPDRTWRANALAALLAAAAALPFAWRIFAPAGALLCAAATATGVFLAFTMADRAGT